MSWIFGTKGNYKNNLEKNFINKNLLFSFQSENLKIFAGGVRENILFEKINEFSGWAVCGIGIKKNNLNYCFMDFNGWKEFLSKEANPEKLNGHFIVVKWNNDEIKVFNDQLGVRDLYILRNKNFTVFSTRLDFFSFVNHNFEINFKELSGYWLLSFPPSTNSLFKGIIRLGPGGNGKISIEGVIKKNTPLLFNFRSDFNTDEYIQNLNNVTTFPLLHNQRISLGLTGGLDSRVLLSVLLDSNYKNWQVHFFGSRDLPDVKIAEQIASDKDIPSQYMYNKLSDPNECLSLLRNYISQLGPVSMAHLILFYQYYSTLFKQGRVVIDGGQGEIHRRESLNRILFLAKNSIVKKDSLPFYKAFSRYRANIFNNEAFMLMEKEALDQISNLFYLMPEPKDIGLENWLDLLMLRYQLPNFSGTSQILLDSMSVSYMPYIQLNLLEQTFCLSVKLKKNGRIFKDIINKGNHRLDSYKLAKDSIYYPYKTNSFTKRIILLTEKKIGKYYKDRTGEEFLNVMKEYIFDTINSQDFNSFGYYNNNKIKQMINDYYNGNKKLENEVNWWLTFDIWRSIYLKRNS